MPLRPGQTFPEAGTSSVLRPSFFFTTVQDSLPYFVRQPGALTFDAGVMPRSYARRLDDGAGKLAIGRGMAARRA